MSLDTLPYEIFQFIASPLDKRDHLSLCLINKKLLPFAQPLLFRTVSLTLSGFWFNEGNDWKSPSDLEKWTRNCFFRTLSSLPHLAASISSLGLRLDPALLDNTPRFQLTVSLLQSTINLHHLRLEALATARGSLSSEMVEAIPSSLRSLEIVLPILNQGGMQRILERLGSLESLNLTRAVAGEGGDPTGENLLSSRPKHLQIPRSDLDWRPFFHDLLLQAASSLKIYEGPVVSVGTLKDVQLPRLQCLRLTCGRQIITGGSSDTIYRESVQPFVRDLRLTLLNAPRLEYLKVGFFYCCGAPQYEANTINLFEVMPKSIKTISLQGPGLWSAPSLIRFLASTSASVDLETLRVREPQCAADEVFKQQIEDLCEMRGIAFAWMMETGPDRD
ncbi:hypothetical protein JCM5350_008216 [Sporobolomyces pararoseus]